MDISKPQSPTPLRISNRLQGLEPVGPEVLDLEGKTIIVHKTLLSGFDKQSFHFTSQMVCVVEGRHTVHAVQPCSYVTARPASYVSLPRLVTMTDGTQMCALRAQAGLGEDEDKAWFQVSDGKSFDHKLAVWVDSRKLKSFDGPVENLLGQRKWLSFTSAFMSRDPELRDVGLTSAVKVHVSTSSRSRARWIG